MFKFFTLTRNRIVAAFVIVVALTLFAVTLRMNKQSKTEEKEHEQSLIWLPRLRKQRKAS